MTLTPITDLRFGGFDDPGEATAGVTAPARSP